MKKLVALALVLGVFTVDAGLWSKIKSGAKKVRNAAVSPIKNTKQKTSKSMWEKKVKKAVKKCLDIADDIFAEKMKDANVKNFRETVKEWYDDWSKLLVYTTKNTENMCSDLIDSEVDEESVDNFRKSATNLIKLFSSYSALYLEIIDNMYEEIEETIDEGTDGRDEMLKLLQDYSIRETIRSNDNELLGYIEDLEKLGTDVEQLKEKFYLLKRIVTAVQQGTRDITYQTLKKDWEKMTESESVE